MAKMTLGSSNSAPVQRSVASPIQSAPEPITIVKEVIRELPMEHHYHNTTHHETTKTRDSRARNYIKALKMSLQNGHKKSVENLNVRMDLLSNRIKELENKKPEEKQVLTVETKHIETKNTETIREVSTSMDKRMILLIALATIVNVIVILIK